MELFALVQRRRVFTERQTRHLFKQMVSAVNYLHQNQLCHRDIKLENFLILEKEDKIEKVTLKMIDFGLARYFKDEKTDRIELMSTKAGTA